MNTDFDFFITTMPDSRQADFYLGCLDSSVFIDFNNTSEGRICLIRISFDGYGCCNLKNPIPLNTEDSVIFKKIMKEKIKEQSAITTIIKKAISLNKESIWADALKEHELI